MSGERIRCLFWFEDTDNTGPKQCGLDVAHVGDHTMEIEKGSPWGTSDAEFWERATTRIEARSATGTADAAESSSASDIPCTGCRKPCETEDIEDARPSKIIQRIRVPLLTCCRLPFCTIECHRTHVQADHPIRRYR